MKLLWWGELIQQGGPVPAALLLVGGGEAAGPQDPLAEVALVVGAAQQDLVDFLHLGECEPGGEEGTRDMQVLFETRA